MAKSTPKPASATEQASTAKVVSFEAGKERLTHQRKELKAEAIRQAFRQARGEADKSQRAASNTAKAKSKKSRKQRRK